ncbi:unnamed protein product [Calicophoron daubneyi]|uniref:Band 7 domain-containing protein n=1 Tax=Calicophoron daubneyi TaxID=300641 RepID=A0AAV2T2L5_CALDB
MSEDIEQLPRLKGRKESGEQIFDSGGQGFCGVLLIIIAVIFYICLLPITIFFSFRIIEPYERGLKLRLGKIVKSGKDLVYGAGIRFVLPGVDKIVKIDMRTTTVSIPPQDILTSDSVTVSVDAVVYMRVIEPAVAVLRVQNWKYSAELLAVSTLRSVLGGTQLTELLQNRDELDSKLRCLLDEITKQWGVRVERVEIKDVSLPQEMQRSMAAEAQAVRAANAKVIAAKGEYDSAEMLQEAARKMASSPGAMQLRYLQTLTSIAMEHNSTIIFPIPLELFRGHVVQQPTTDGYSRAM